MDRCVCSCCLLFLFFVVVLVSFFLTLLLRIYDMRKHIGQGTHTLPLNDYVGGMYAGSMKKRKIEKLACCLPQVA